MFLRRCDLIALGFSDARIDTALRQHRIFRVRQGWYSVPDAPQAGVEAVRVGGKLTGLSALLSYGLIVPEPALLQVAVRETASRLRSPTDRRQRRTRSSPVRVFWTLSDDGPSPWRVTVLGALAVVMTYEEREVVVAAISAALHRQLIDHHELAALFAAAGRRARGLIGSLSPFDESFGETFVRLRLQDAGIVVEQQVEVEGAGWYDFRVHPAVYVEVDGSQHGEPGQWREDHRRDILLAARGARVIRVTYAQLLHQWPAVLTAIKRAIADAKR